MSFLVDPHDVINYNRSRAELELFWLFCGVVAGKTAAVQAKKLELFLNDLPSASLSPFNRIFHGITTGTLRLMMERHKLGQYDRLTRFMLDSYPLNLPSASLDELMRVRGCGPKTARMFLMFTRPDQRVAALDTHVLKHLAAHGHAVPKATPPEGQRYRELEQIFLTMADEANMSVADYDLMIWKRYTK